MGWSGGTFSRVHDWTDDAAAGENIEASRMDAEDDNFATGINSCVHKGGQNTAIANLPMGGYKHTSIANATARDQYAAAGQVQDGGLVYATAGGSANALTLTLAPAITAYATGQEFVVKASATNTAATTIAVSGLAAKNIYSGGAPLIGGEIVSGRMYVLVYNGTQFELVAPGGASQISCQVNRTGDQTIPDDTTTAITWQAEGHDYGGFWTAGNPTRLTVPAAGVYTLQACVAWEGNVTGTRLIYFDPTGAYGVNVGQTNADTDTNTHYMTLNYPASYFTGTDYLELYVWQNSGSSLKILYSHTLASIFRVA